MISERAVCGTAGLIGSLRVGSGCVFFDRKIRFFFPKKTNGRNIPTLAIVVVLSGKPGALVNDQTTDNHRDLEKKSKLVDNEFSKHIRRRLASITNTMLRLRKISDHD